MLLLTCLGSVCRYLFVSVIHWNLTMWLYSATSLQFLDSPWYWYTPYCECIIHHVSHKLIVTLRAWANVNFSHSNCLVFKFECLLIVRIFIFHWSNLYSMVTTHLLQLHLMIIKPGLPACLVSWNHFCADIIMYLYPLRLYLHVGQTKTG